MDFEILVQLKEDVLDPEARAIRDTLRSRGISDVSEVRVAKRYVISLNSERVESAQTIQKIAEDYLANPVSQTYQIRRLEK